MSRKHYIAVAAILAANPAIGTAEVKKVGYDLADFFALDNPNFDRARFLAAAGVYSEDKS